MNNQDPTSETDNETPSASPQTSGDGLLRTDSGTQDPDAGQGRRNLLGAANASPAEDGDADTNNDVPEDKFAPPKSMFEGDPTLAAAAALTRKSAAPIVDADQALKKEEEPEAKKTPSWMVKPTDQSMDDPLLGALTVLCSLLDRPVSANALTSGLPLVEGRMTPDLFIQGAERAGISAKIVQRKLNRINRLSLPCVLLLNGQRAAILTDIRGDNGVIVLPEVGAGAREVPYKELEAEYVGYALFAKPEFKYDGRAEESRVDDPKGWFWGTIFSNWKLYIEVMIAALLINSFAIATPLFVMNVYDRVVPNFAEETLWVLAIGMLTVFFFDFILKLLRGYLVDVAGKAADTKIASRLFQQMLGMKMKDRPPSAGAMANNMRGFEQLREFFTSSTITTVVDFPFIFLFLAIIYVLGNIFIVLVPLTIVVLVLVVGLLMQIPMHRAVAETYRESQQKHAILVEAISGIEAIKTASAESRMQRSWEIFVGKTAQSSMKSNRWSQIATHFSGSMTQMVTVGVVVVGVYQIQEGAMSVGALVACSLLSGRALAPLGQVAGIATRFHQSKQALDGLHNMMLADVERPQGRTFVHRPSFSGKIEFKDVSFSYPGGETKALDKVSIKVEPGEKIGIIGRIGSGKSTIEKLLVGLFDPDDGAVMLDGTDIRQVDPADLRKNIGIVPQDYHLFYGSIKENIALGAPYADDAAIMRAARIAGVDEFASKHPHGLDMQVGERGANLSGGQRQAVAIARAMLMDPPILVFDEPTSSMDNTTEGRFKARLGSIAAHKTMVLVTHRGSLLSLVDRLIVMDGGRIVADGPKDMVMEALTSGRIQTAKV